MKLLSKLNVKLHTTVIKYLINRQCGERISSRYKYNCFWIGFYKDDFYAYLEEYKDNKFIGKVYLNDILQGNKEFDIKDLLKYKIKIEHFYNHSSFSIEGFYSFLLQFIFIKIYVIFLEKFSSLNQFLFNKKSLASKKRHQFLKLLIDNYTGYSNGFSVLQVVEKIHSIKVYLHPQFHEETNKVRALLDGLKDTGELKIINSDYHLTGQAFKSLDEYEEQDRKHKSLNRTQWVLIFVTVGLLITGLIQANVISIPTILNFTK